MYVYVDMYIYMYMIEQHTEPRSGWAPDRDDSSAPITEAAGWPKLQRSNEQNKETWLRMTQTGEHHQHK